jgi:replicative DNA helicase
LIVLGARTSHGKSVFCFQIGMHVARSVSAEWLASGADTPPGQVVLFSPELTVTSIMERYASQRSGVPVLSVKRGQASDEERQRWLAAAEEFALLSPCYKLWAGEGMSAVEIVDHIEAAHIEGPPVRLAVVDYLQYLDLASLSSNYFEALGRSAKRFRDVANRLNIPILVAAQLNRDVEKARQGGDERPPELSDFEGSGKIEQTCNVGILLWRPPEPQRSTGAVKPQEATVFIRKNTDGPTGECKMLYYPDLALFADLPSERVQSDGGTL